MVKKLTQVGESSALVVDRALMEQMEIDADTPLKVTVEGRRLIVEPCDAADRREQFEQAMKAVAERHAELFRRLAK